MRIVISAVSSARRPSGICRHAANLAIALSRRPEVLVTLLVGDWQLGYFRGAFGLQGRSFDIIPIAIAPNAFARNHWYYLRLPEIAQRYQADLVHLSFPAPFRRSRFSCPIVLSLHDLYPYDAPRNFGYSRVLFNRAFLRQSLRASDAIVCSSRFTLDRLRHYARQIAAQKATQIYQSVTFDPGAEAALAALHHLRQPFLLAVAQHRRNKNLDLLLSAFAQFRQQESKREFRLVIVGSAGPETTALHAIAKRLSVDQHVLFLSQLSDQELCRLYHSCELMVVPSSIEGFCFPLAEALRCGSRVLCSDIAILREIGESRCDYFRLQPDNPAALASAIEAALLRPLPCPHTSDRFSPDEIARQYLVLYSSLLAGSQQPALPPQLCHESAP
ncbi:MAG TPA: glycosyltransferase family 1 protein [Terriglobales bacterium]|nr:glycosyltransferase family 1 protein [Terriglobales bacterium]